MLTDSTQPYNKRIIDFACSVWTVKYQTSVFLHWPRLLKISVWYFTVQTPRSVNNPLLLFPKSPKDITVSYESWRYYCPPYSSIFISFSSTYWYRYHCILLGSTNTKYGKYVWEKMSIRWSSVRIIISDRQCMHFVYAREYSWKYPRYPGCCFGSKQKPSNSFQLVGGEFGCSWFNGWPYNGALLCPLPF